MVICTIERRKLKIKIYYNLELCMDIIKLNSCCKTMIFCLGMVDPTNLKYPFKANNYNPCVDG